MRRFDDDRLRECVGEFALRLEPRMSGGAEVWHVRWSSRDSHGVVFVPLVAASEAWQAELHALSYLLCARRPIARKDIEGRAPILVRSDNLPRLRELFAVSRQLRDYFRVLDTEYAELPLRVAPPGVPWPHRRTEPELQWATDHIPGVPTLHCAEAGRLRVTRRALADAAELDAERPAWAALERFCKHARAFDSVGDKPNRRLLICDLTGWVATIVDQDMIGVRPASTYELIRLWNRAGANPTQIRRRLAREADPKARAGLLRLLIEHGGQGVEVCFADGRSARVTGHAVDRVMTRMNAATPESAIALLRRAARRATPSRLPKLIELIKMRAHVAPNIAQDLAPTDFFKTRDGWEFTVCEGQLVSVYFRDPRGRTQRDDSRSAACR